MPEEYQEFQGAVVKLNTSIYGLVQVGRSCNSRLTDDLKMLGFE